MRKARASKVYMGIDPGQSGAVAVIYENQEIFMLADWPGDEIQAARMVKFLKKDVEPAIIVAALEKATAMPKQGVTSMFKFGTNYGIWKGILASFEISFIEITPRTWQKGVISKAQDKKPALAAAGRMFPKAVLVGPRGGGKDGRADSLLIADFIRRQHNVK